MRFWGHKIKYLKAHNSDDQVHRFVHHQQCPVSLTLLCNIYSNDELIIKHINRLFCFLFFLQMPILQNSLQALSRVLFPILKTSWPCDLCFSFNNFCLRGLNQATSRCMKVLKQWMWYWKHFFKVPRQHPPPNQKKENDYRQTNNQIHWIVPLSSFY